MKTKASLERSAKAALKQALTSGNRTMECLERLHDSEGTETMMPALRNELAQLTKSVHEFNAYYNALTTV